MPNPLSCSVLLLAQHCYTLTLSNDPRQQHVSHFAHLQLQVQVSMMFEGQSAVEVNPKINVEELKSFTSMSLYIKLPKDNQQLAASPDRFILYLGNKNVRE